MNIVMIGGTGAVGTEVLKALLSREETQSIKILVRKLHTDLAISNSPKIKQVIVNIFDPASYEDELSGAEVAISTFGIGEPSRFSRDEFYRTDYECVREFAIACRRKGISHFLSLGSAGVSPKSKSFYLKTKANLETQLIQLKFERLSLFRPSVIITPHNRYGFLQFLTLKLYPVLDPLLVGRAKQFRSIKVSELGQAIANRVFMKSNSATETLRWSDFWKESAE